MKWPLKSRENSTSGSCIDVFICWSETFSIRGWGSPRHGNSLAFYKCEAAATWMLRCQSKYPSCDNGIDVFMWTVLPRAGENSMEVWQNGASSWEVCNEYPILWGKGSGAFLNLLWNWTQKSPKAVSGVLLLGRSEAEAQLHPMLVYFSS